MSIFEYISFDTALFSVYVYLIIRAIDIRDCFERKTDIFIVILLFHSMPILLIVLEHEKIFTIASNDITVRDVTLERLPFERDPRST